MLIVTQNPHSTKPPRPGRTRTPELPGRTGAAAARPGRDRGAPPGQPVPRTWRSVVMAWVMAASAVMTRAGGRPASCSVVARSGRR
ncbi:hypothetical protein ACFQYP_09455 [Nonomuraea antimicrobica]